MDVIYIDDRWPLRVQTYMPDHSPLTVANALVTVTRLDDGVVVVPTMSVAPLGIYLGYVEYRVEPPTTSTEGNYIVDWDIIIGTIRKSHRQFFQVISIPEYSLAERALINALRMRLKDNRPELYRVDEQEQKWFDEELYSFLYYGLADFNGIPPFWTSYTFETLPAQVHPMVLLVAQIFSLIAEATLQAANDFSYNDNGLTVTLSRSGKYMAIAGQLWGMYGPGAARVKRFMGFDLTSWVGVKTQRMPISVRRPLSMLPHLESIFSSSGSM